GVGASFDYQPAGKLVRIGPRDVIDRSRDRAWPPLPAGPSGTFDFKDARVADITGVLADRGGATLVFPDNLDAEGAPYAKDIPWYAALRGILSVTGLDYSYHFDTRKLEVTGPKTADKAATKLADVAKLPRGPEVNLDFVNADVVDIVKILAEKCSIG